MCRGTVIVQAPARSGALITADFAAQEGRDLFVHREGLVGGDGGGQLAEDGAPVITSALQVATEWNLPVPAGWPVAGAADPCGRTAWEIDGRAVAFNGSLLYKPEGAPRG